jgi:HPt (histidine-containing phosphotransfer) domain-containing protein
MTEKAIDFAYLSRQTAGDHELDRELLTLFAQQCAVHLRTIHGNADRQARIDAAHTLKGAARAVGAWQVAEAADRIEASLSRPEQAVSETALDALALAAAEARAVIARFDCAT